MLDCSWVPVGFDVLVENWEIVDVDPNKVESFIFVLDDGSEEATIGGGVAERARYDGDGENHGINLI